MKASLEYKATPLARFLSSFEEARAANVGGIPGYDGKDIFRVQLELVEG